MRLKHTTPYGIAINPDNNKGEWDQPSQRRQGLRDLHKVHRYGMSVRSPNVLPLQTNINFELADLKGIEWYTRHPFFTGLAVLKRDCVVYEDYAADFGAQDIHSVQSITKTLINIIAGKLVKEGRLCLSSKIKDYLPDIGSGYVDATVQQVMDMDVVNDYSEDYYDPNATLGELEDAHGWRIMQSFSHRSLREFLTTVSGENIANSSRALQYKTANTDLLGWVCEVCSGVPLRSYVIDIIEAAGIEDTAYLSTDRDGVPFVGGGMHMTLRDLARYGLMLGGGMQNTGNDPFDRADMLVDTRNTSSQGTICGDGLSYRNFLETNGKWIGHLGYGGQWLMVFPEEGVVIACLSALLDDGGLDRRFIDRLIEMGEAIYYSIT